MTKENGGLSMLLEFSCSNHKSIKDKIFFSMIAGKDETNEELLYKYDNVRVLNGAVIYGANGSGKSNFIDAIRYMKSLVINSIKNQPGNEIRQMPHKLLSINDDSKYFIQFITKGIRYAFGFTINKCLIKEEYLYVFPNGRQQKVYTRTNEKIIPGDKYKGKFDLCEAALKPNRLLISCAANFSEIEDVLNVYKFFRDELVIYISGSPFNTWMSYSLTSIYTNAKVKENVLNLLKYFGTGIKDLQIKVEKKEITEADIPSFLSDEAKIEILKQNTIITEAKVVYENFKTDLMGEESRGVRKLIEFMCPFIDIILKGKVLVCDEIETSLHESIVFKIFNYFKKSRSLGGQFAQMISTTHDTSILSLELFRRDQIWFTELKPEDRSTDLYSLTEIKNVRKDENISKGYIAGKYGAIPMLNNTIETLIK